jgi:beta-lactamase superfamily II metal-dependent hydrolase
MRCLSRWLLALGLWLLASPAPAQEPWGSSTGRATVEFLDVGQGDAVLIHSPEGKKALVDAGPSHHVVSLLRLRGVASLDLAVVTHHHADHYGGMADAIKAFRPRVFLATGSSHTSQHYLRLLELVRDQGARAVQPAREVRRVGLGSVELTVFPQAPLDPKEENNNSIGLRVRYGTVSVLLPGDAEAAERRWWEQHAPDLCARCDILKLAHHGSRNGTDARWLSLVRPKLAVASLGRDNEFGHPHPETLALLARAGVPLLRTDQNGSIKIETDGRAWRVVGHPTRSRAPPADVAEAPARPSHSEHHKPHPVGRVDVNTATEDELRTVPGIGPVIARRIIEGRPYSSVDDLGTLEGIGKTRLAEIRPYVTVR